jgi:hypothetical protein
MGTNFFEEATSSLFSFEVVGAGATEKLVLFTGLYVFVSHKTSILLKCFVSDSWFLEFLPVGFRFMVLIQRNTMV